MSRLSLRTRWLILLALVSLLLIGAPQPTDAVAVEAFKKGAQLATPEVRWQDLDEPTPQNAQISRQATEAAYQRAIERRSLDPQPWRYLGDHYAAWGRQEDAAHAYGQALLRGDEAADFDRSLAQLFTILRDSRQALHHWSEYLVRRPDDRIARLALAWTAIQLANWERARAELEHLLADDPDDTMVHAWLGLLLIGPDPTAGLQHLEYAANDPVMAGFLAPVFVAERLSAAVDSPAYRSALLGISFLNLDVSVLHRVAEPELSELGHSTEDTLRKTTTTLALRSLLATVSRNPGYADAYAYLGQALDQLGWSNWAHDSLQYALELAARSPVAQTLMGLYWDRHGSPALARHYYEMAYSQDQDNASLGLEIAMTYLVEGEYTAAETWLLFVADIAPDDPRIWETLAQCYVDMGIDVGQSGLAAVRHLLELAPNNARAHDLMGWVYFLTGDDALAAESLDQALALDPGLASAYYHMGRLYARQGRYVEASQNYGQAAGYDVAGQLTAQLERAWDELPQTLRDGP
jgi:tetratricopeptide (TPR) repeat protein